MTSSARVKPSTGEHKFNWGWIVFCGSGVFVWEGFRVEVIVVVGERVILSKGVLVGSAVIVLGALALTSFPGLQPTSKSRMTKKY